MEIVTVKGHTWFRAEVGLRIGEGRAKLLEQVNLSGSISEAARQPKIPCRRAWRMVREMSNSTKEPLIIKKVGGKDDRHSVLAKEGKKIVVLSRKVDQCFKNFSEDGSYRLNRRQE